MDFTLKTYQKLLDALQLQGFSFQTFAGFIRSPIENAVILRHDVDKLPGNALVFARIQHSRGIKATYYFRVVPGSWNSSIICEIAAMGHEIGYHYETMDSENTKCKMQNAKCNTEELVDRAYDMFCSNLGKFREIVPVETVCMHGSPRSKYDNRDIWRKYDYRKLGIIGEPYFDIDFSKMAYLTDTGRMWDGEKYSVRDKAIENRKSEIVNRKSSYHSTFDIIKTIEAGTFPDQAMMTFHPQRWHDNFYDWSNEFVLQNIKNIIKRTLYVTPDR
jgi:hypothetical protein